MATAAIPSVKSCTRTDIIITTLGYVALEWLLIFMLLINSMFSFLITKFACHCGLQTPCLLCTRLDHFFGGHDELKHSWDLLLCTSHKLVISSLVFCHAHKKLVNVHGMCENCLFSFATINKSNAETYRLLVGKLGEDSAYHSDWDPSIEGCTQSAKHCTCCNKPLVPRQSGQKLVLTTSFSSRAADLDAPYPGASENGQDNLKKSSQSLSQRATPLSCGPDPLPHVGYTELLMHSDIESEAQFSDDDDQIVEAKLREGVEVECLRREHPILTLSDELSTEKMIDSVFAPDLLTSVSELHTHVLESNRVTFEWHKIADGHGLEEINLKPADCKIECYSIHEDKKLDEISAPTITAETRTEASIDNILICLSDVPHSSNSGKMLAGASEEGKFDFVDAVPPPPNARETPTEALNEGNQISLNEVPASLDSKTPVQDLEHNCLGRDEEIWQTYVTDSDGICNEGNGPATSTKADQDVNPVSGDTVQIPNLLDLSDAYKLAVGNKGRQLSGVHVLEQWNDKESLRLSENLKLLISQFSAVREHLINDASPRPSMSPNISLNSDELKTYDATGAMGMNALQKRISLDRNESGLSLDGSIVSEIEGESMTDRLRRQVEHDKKLLGVLYKELEEERNASAIAANQALAMITRLQEEKASLHMEALQCLRMMEEQAEYDEKALAKTNDLLSKSEKQLQDLETELEFYRNKFLDESVLKSTMMPPSNVIISDTGPAEVIRSRHVREKYGALFDDKNMAIGDNFSFVFEDEKLYILRNLRKLEKKLYLFSTSGLQKDLTNGQYFGNEDRVSELNGKLSMDPCEASKSAQGHSPDESESICKENIEISCGARSFSVPYVGAGLDSFANEFADLNERLETLEADRSFLQQTINTMRSGEEGHRFIQEIASSLKELRRMGIRRREQIVAWGP